MDNVFFILFDYSSGNLMQVSFLLSINIEGWKKHVFGVSHTLACMLGIWVIGDRLAANMLYISQK